MEALAALGLASNILQFVEFSSKIVRGASTVYQSASGLPAELQDVAAITRSLGFHMNKLVPPAIDSTKSSGGDALIELDNGCRKTCAELQQVMEKIRGKEPGSRRDSLRVAWRALRQKEKLEELERRINRYRSQILTQLLFDMRDNQNEIHACIRSKSPLDEEREPETRSEFLKAKEDVIGLLQTAVKNNQTVTSHVDASAQHGDALQEISIALSALSTTIKTINAERTILDLLWFSELNHRTSAIQEARRGTYRWLLHDPDIDSEQDVYDDAPEGSPPPFDLSLDVESPYSASRDFQTENNGTGRSDQSQVQEAEAPKSELPPASSTGNQVEIGSTSSKGNDSTVLRRSSVATMTSLLKENTERKEWRDRFVSWLRNDNGVFYISGKPGSGKSTLMKSIANDSRTQQLLHAWAKDDGKNLILVRFFFWNSGTELQQNIEGLYRTMLWEILKQRPELTARIFPKLFDEACNGTLHQSEISPSLLENAFRNVITNQNLLGLHKICFFIDGLDEYKGDYWKLAKYLKSWCSVPDVKLCLSSRPYNEFVKVLAPRAGSWLKLHELTHGDILRVVRGEFADDERFLEARQRSAEYDYFVGTIVTKAEGVFIWVTLAIRSILSGIGNSCSLPQLHKRVESVPNELGAMFRYMLEEIEQSERQAAARTFLILKEVDEDMGSNTWAYLHAVIDELFDEPDYGSNLFHGSAGRLISNEECVSKCTTMVDRITGRCRGLVQVIHTGETFPKCHKLQFVHRTVADFLGEEETMNELRSVARNFRSLKTRAHGLISMAKHVPRIWDFECPDSSPGKEIHTRYTFHFDTTFLIHPLLRLAAVAESKGIEPLTAEIEYMKQLSKENIASGSTSSIGTMWFTRWWRFWEWYTTSPNNIDASILCIAVVLGALQFVMKELSELPHNSEHFDLVLVASSIAELQYMNLRPVNLTDVPYDTFEIVQHLLEGQASPNRDLSCIVQNVWPNRRQAYCSSPPWTPWTTYLFALAQAIFSERESRTERWEKRLRLYLRHGADPSVCFVGYRVSFDMDGAGTRVDGSQHDGISLQASGPFYVDLCTMLEVWGLERSILADSLGNRSFFTARARVGRWFDTLTRRESAKRDYEQAGAHDLPWDRFLVLKVVSLERLGEVTVSDLEGALESARQRLDNAHKRGNFQGNESVTGILSMEI